jgi:hypothetical protein
MIKCTFSFSGFFEESLFLRCDLPASFFFKKDFEVDPTHFTGSQ